MENNEGIQIILSRPDWMTQEEWKDYKRYEKKGIKMRLKQGAGFQLLNVKPDKR